MRCWRGYLLEQSANSLHMVQLMPLPPHHVCFSKIQNGLSFWYDSPGLSWTKGRKMVVSKYELLHVNKMYMKRSLAAIFHIIKLITFCMRHNRGEIYIDRSRLCFCLSVPRHIPALLHGPRCNFGDGRRCPLIVHYYVDLSVVARVPLL